MLVVVHLFSLMPVGLMAADFASPTQPSQPALQRTSSEVRVNRMLPAHTPASHVAPLSADPTDDKIGRLRLFAHRLVPVEPAAPQSLLNRLSGARPVPKRSAENNQHAVAALRALQQSTDPNDTSLLEQFIAGHPQSRWSASVAISDAPDRRQRRAGAKHLSRSIGTP